jgi:hypothetical protein
VFPFEIEDFSAAGKQEPSPKDAEFLDQSTEETKQQLVQSGRYSLIDTAGADLAPAKGQGLRNCRGCEAAIANSLGADQALIGIVTKISMTEYVVTLRISDARTGEPVSNYSTDLRMGTADSWFRGVRSLMKNRVLASAEVEATAPQPIPIAVAEFDYRDTSGETRDQRAEHAARLEAFARMIRADLEKSGRFRIVPIACGEGPCAAGEADPEELLATARKAGARLLLFGGIQKMSTLIQYGKAIVIDLEADKSIFERLVSFRGDTDDAWRHAEQFLAREFLAQDLRL